MVTRDPARGSSAANAGIKQHDVLLKLDGQPLKSVKQLMALASEAKNRRKLKLTLSRDGVEHTVKLRPGRRPGIEVRILLRDDDALKKLLKSGRDQQ